MPNKEHIEHLKAGADAWEKWRDEKKPLNVADFNKAILVRENFSSYKLEKVFFHCATIRGTKFVGSDLTQATFTRSDARNCDFSNACLLQADFGNVDAARAKFRGANLSGSNFKRGSFHKASFSGADLSNINMRWADLREANFEGANLQSSDLRFSVLINANLKNANISGCQVYGLSAWGVDLQDAIQKNLIITPHNEPQITVDNLEIAQFLYLLLKNSKIRNVIDAVASKVVLILGRFSADRKPVLDALQEALRLRNYVPVLFDFDTPASRNVTETVRTLAHLAKFVLADITDAKSIPQELANIVPSLPSVPIQPIMLEGRQEYGMFNDFRDYPWVLQLFEYRDEAHLLTSLSTQILTPPEDYIRQSLSEKADFAKKCRKRLIWLEFSVGHFSR